MCRASRERDASSSARASVVADSVRRDAERDPLIGSIASSASLTGGSSGDPDGETDARDTERAPLVVSAEMRVGFRDARVASAWDRTKA